MNKLFKHQLFQLISAHFKETIREPGVLFWGILFPIAMSFGLGLAFSKKADTVRKVAYIVVAETGKNDTAPVIQSYLLSRAEKIDSADKKSSYYKITMRDNKLGNTTFLIQKMDWQSAIIELKRGSLNVILTEKNNQVEYHFDPANPDAQLTHLLLSRLFNSSEVMGVTSNENFEPLTLQGTRYIDFLIPGLIAMGIMMSSMWGLSYGIIEKRSKKLLRRMVATPMKKSNFLISLITVRLGMNFIEALLLFIFAFFAFKIRIQGSVPALIVIFIASNIAFAGIAVFISSRTAKTEIGNGLINFVVFPMMLLSGIFFSYHNFPDWSIPYIQKIPLTLVADAIRSIFIEGAGFAQITIPFVILSAIGVFFFGAGLKVFKWY
jgi:ABC-type multidrug transport system permease subunit